MISLLVVNYRSARLAVDAVRTARAATSHGLQVVIVDNSVDPAEAEALRAAGADALILSTTNRGYAGAINDGRKACRGEVIVVSNPDVAFGEASIDRLAEALDARTAVSGPALCWDDAQRWFLPPADVHSAWEAFDAALASRWPAWFGQRDRRRFHRRVAFWMLERTTAVDALSGAVMAIRAADFDALGGFDERFALYFEETDFLRRAREAGRRVAYVPAARCRHLYNQSAAQTGGEAAAQYARSESRYLEKWNGPFVARAIKSFERPAPADGRFEEIDGPIVVDRPLECVVEASPLPTFVTAAGTFPEGAAVDLPPEVLSSYRGTEVFLRVVERSSGRVIGRYVRRISAAGG
ncbi:MAG TPA: glycosyltransferase family 2 protein [Thermoanaerobaculia bacterium]|nr:glycosyltransferase family 2 protein [Thermoanaerobaculia bacterium]